MTPPDSHPVLQALLERHSTGPKHLVEPGPSDAELLTLTEAALRAPDHAALVPFRFSAVRGEARTHLASLFEQAARAAGKDADGAALDRERALKAPVTLAVIARLDPGHPQVPAHEQWACVGGAVAYLLLAAKAMGYGAKMLSGAKARSPVLTSAFCGTGETLVGWIAIGTPTLAGRAKPGKPSAGEVLRFWP
ncbi:MAG: nitroreductase [Burkholderiaceae bacterium]|nr:nitroreductase [Burkholderiaceae bacterium]